MGQPLGGSQISALLETVPGIASVLRSPVADAMVNMIRAGAGIGEFRMEDVLELIQFATRRGLVGVDEGERITIEVQAAVSSRRPRAAAKGRSKSKKARRPAKRAASRPPHRPGNPKARKTQKAKKPKPSQKKKR